MDIKLMHILNLTTTRWWWQLGRHGSRPRSSLVVLFFIFCFVFLVAQIVRVIS